MRFGNPTLAFSFAPSLSASARNRLADVFWVPKRNEAILLHFCFSGTNQQGGNMKKERNPVDEGREEFNRFTRDIITRLAVGSLILAFLRIYFERPEWVRAAIQSVISYFS